jgi:hypothetical protein
MNESERARTVMMIFVGETADALTQLSGMLSDAPHNIKHAADTAAMHFRQLLAKSEKEGPDPETIRQLTEAALSLTEYVSGSIKGNAVLFGKYNETLIDVDATILHLHSSLAGSVLCL